MLKNAVRIFRQFLQIPPMTVIESIVRDLNGMPMRKRVEVARYVHRLSETVERERAEVLRETHGYLSEEDGRIFEQALENSRRFEARG
jgi:predicted amino acid racemase